MTDISRMKSVDLLQDGKWRRWARPLDAFVPYACVIVGTALGLAIGRALGIHTGDDEPSLTLLLRFMAAMKFAAVLGAAAAVQWRRRHPIAPKWARAYLAALVIMAPAPGLIFSLGAVATGALLFHIGLLVFLYVAWKDDRLRLPTSR